MMSKDEINTKLIDRYGLDLSGQPKYRVVWSNDETEVRVGEFSEYYGDIFLRKITGAREVPKYTYIVDRWVLEVLVPTLNPELLTKLSYEPLFVLQDKAGDFLPLEWRPLEIIINALENRVRKPPRSEKQDDYDEKADFEAEKQRNLDYLNAVGRTDIQQKFANRTAVVNAWEKKNE